MAPLVNENPSPEISKDLGTDKDVLTPVAHHIQPQGFYKTN